MHKPITILVADDDPDDRLLIMDAIDENHVSNTVDFVKDGEELMNYLHRHQSLESLTRAPLPGLILLDLNMPKKDGLTALHEIKADADLRRIPVVVLTTSRASEDIAQSYGSGVSSFITKPTTFEALSDMVRTLAHYWSDIVTVPSECQNTA